MRLDGTATIHDAVPHRDRPGLPPSSPSLGAICGSAEKGLQPLVENRLCEV